MGGESAGAARLGLEVTHPGTNSRFPGPPGLGALRERRDGAKLEVWLCH